MQTFSGWVPLPENRSALSAVQRVAQVVRQRKSRSAQNPLFLHGPAGTGKSHLLNALLLDATQTTPDLVVTLLAAREFTPPGVMNADDLTATIRDADLVLVEDLQNLPDAAVERFVQLVDHCRTRGRQLVITAVVGPAALNRLPGRLVTRLSAGLVVRLDPLSPASRLAFLKKRVEQKKQKVAPEVLDWLAEHLPGSVRQLDSALARLETLGQMSGKPIGLDDVDEHFRDDRDARSLTVEFIAQSVGRYFRIEPNLLQERGRGHHALVPRQVGMYLARRLTPLSLEQIGAYFGGRDHTTVLYACRKVEEALVHDAALSGAVRQLQADLA